MWVIVAKRSQGDIERYLTEHPEFPKTVHFIFLKFHFNQFLRKIWPPSYYWYNRHWHKKAYDLAVKLHNEVNFDIDHQLTMVGFREPGYLWKLGIPFVWGPVGGMGFFPWRFLHKIGLYGAIYYLGYNLYNFLQMQFLKRPRIAANTAGSGLIAATQENQAGAKYYWGCPSTIIPEVVYHICQLLILFSGIEGTVTYRMDWFAYGRQSTQYRFGCFETLSF